MLKLIGEVYRVVHRSAPVDAVLVLALEIDLGAKGIARAVQGVKPQGIVDGEVVAADGLLEIRLPVVPFGARIFPDIAQDSPYFQRGNDQPGARSVAGGEVVIDCQLIRHVGTGDKGKEQVSFRSQEVVELPPVGDPEDRSEIPERPHEVSLVRIGDRVVNPVVGRKQTDVCHEVIFPDRLVPGAFRGGLERQQGGQEQPEKQEVFHRKSCRWLATDKVRIFFDNKKGTLGKI